jgi:hypothetical protein
MMTSLSLYLMYMCVCVPSSGVGLMMTRLGEGGKVNKGPMGVGMRLQDNFRVGAFKVRCGPCV